MTGNPAPRQVPDDGIRPFPRGSLHKAARFLFEVYRADPAFAQLLGLGSKVDLAGVSPSFDGLCNSTAHIPGSTLGCYREGKVVGVVSYYPDLMTPLLRLLVLHPLQYAACILKGVYIKWASRPRVPPAARARWRAYDQLVRAHAPQMPRLHIMALGVAGFARSMGIGRQLLEAVASDERWREHVEVVQVDTWHRTKVAIYERLGFHVIAHGSREGVDCWTMVRPVPKNGSAVADPSVPLPTCAGDHPVPAQPPVPTGWSTRRGRVRRSGEA